MATMAYSKTELKKLEKYLSQLEGAQDVHIESSDKKGWQSITVHYRAEELGYMDFEVEATDAFDTYEALQKYCEDKINDDLNWDDEE